MGHISLSPDFGSLPLCTRSSCFDSVLAHLLSCVRRSLGCSPGQGNCGSLCGGVVEERTVSLLADFWGISWLSPYFQSLHPLPVCDWCLSSCCPGCGSQVRWVCMCWALLKKQQFFPPPQAPLGLHPEVMRLSLCHATLSGLGLGLLAYRVSPWFLSTTCECGAAHSASCHYLSASPPLAYHCHTKSSPP